MAKLRNRSSLWPLAKSHCLSICQKGVAGSPSAIDEHEQSNPWKQETPDATVHLRPVSRSYRGDPPLEDPIIDHRSIHPMEMIVQHEQKLQKQRESVLPISLLSPTWISGPLRPSQRRKIVPH